MYVSVLARVRVYRVLRQYCIWYITRAGGEKKKERKLYIGTSKKVYFTIPLAVEDRLLFIGFNYSIHRRKKDERNRALYIHVFSLI